MYKYFSEKEVKGLDIKIAQMLERAREFSGIPFILTSTVRSKEKNNEVGGIEKSSHLSGQAVDILAEDSTKRFKIITALITIGFRRIGIYKHHIHADIDKSKADIVMWLG